MFPKSKIVSHCSDQIKNKLDRLNQDYQKLTESIASETKSSAGDKYETGREMMNQEKNKLLDQIGQLRKQSDALKKINQAGKINSVQFGALVNTNQATYLMATPLGKITYEGEVIFVISMTSPIAQQLKGLKAGDSATWQQKEIKILTVE